MAFPSGGPRQNELNFDQIIGQVQQVLGRLTRRFGGGGVGIIVVSILICFGIISFLNGNGLYIEKPSCSEYAK